MGRRSAAFSLLAAALGLVAAAVLLPPAIAANGSAGTGAGAVVESRIIGYSVKHRAIRAWRLGDPTSTNKVVFIGAMHGDEAGPSRILRNLINGPQIYGADIWVVPYLNPDGVARRTRANARRVDLNRNFPVSWIRQTGKYYSGRRPASEPETRTIMRFLRAVNPTFVVSFHQPLYGVDVSYLKTRDLALRLTSGLRLPRKVFNCNRGCHGTMTQWFNRTMPGQAITVEYGRRLSLEQAWRTGPQGLLAAVFATTQAPPPPTPTPTATPTPTPTDPPTTDAPTP